MDPDHEHDLERSSGSALDSIPAHVIASVDDAPEPSNTRASIWINIKAMGALAWPVSASYLLQFSLGLVNLLFIGHLNKEYLDGAALGNMFVNVGGYSIVYGLAAAVDTLCSQAYGAGNYKQVGLIAQRVAVWLTLCCIPILIFWSQCERLLILAQQDAEVAHIAGEYVWRLSPGLIPNVLYEVMKRWLFTQQIMKPCMLIGFFTNLVHGFLCWFLISYLDWGFVGAPVAMCITQYALLLIGFTVVRCGSLHTQTWPDFHAAELFRGWGQIIRLGLPGMMMLCLEWSSFELCAFLAGWQGKVPLASFVIALNILAFCYMLPLGISVSTSTLIGNHLGANKAQQAKYTMIGAICLTITLELCLATTLFLLRNQLGAAYSEDEEVISMIAKVMPFICTMVSFDGYSAVTGGILRGTGHQAIGAGVNLTSYYVMGLPLVLILIYKAHMGIFGIWTGLGSAVTMTSLIQTAYIVRIDWQRECVLAMDRLRDPHAQSASYAQVSTLAEIPMMELELEDEPDELKSGRVSPSHARDPEEEAALSLITVKAKEQDEDPSRDASRYKRASPSKTIHVSGSEPVDDAKQSSTSASTATSTKSTLLNSAIPAIGPVPQPPISPLDPNGLDVRKATSFRAEWDLDSEDERAGADGDDADGVDDGDLDLLEDELLSDEQV